MSLTDILLRAVPDYTADRERKRNFRQYPLHEGKHNGEPLVDIAQYGIAGQSYYSRPNGATGSPVPGVPSAVKVRESIAELLARINHALLESKEVEKLLGGKVELFVNEGYRAPELQKQLYEEVFPKLIRAQHPEYSEEQVNARRSRLIATPARAGSPSPHATGAAVDVRLRYPRADLGHVPGSEVALSAKDVDVSEAIYPDYYEHKKSLTKAEKQLRDNRRVFYWVMRGALLEDDSGFVVNPNEWWHWSYGDQMWAELVNAPEAFFSFAPAP